MGRGRDMSSCARIRTYFRYVGPEPVIVFHVYSARGRADDTMYY